MKVLENTQTELSHLRRIDCCDRGSGERRVALSIRNEQPLAKNPGS
jgi:hypothetical protein